MSGPLPAPTPGEPVPTTPTGYLPKFEPKRSSFGRDIHKMSFGSFYAYPAQTLTVLDVPELNFFLAGTGMLPAPAPVDTRIRNPPGYALPVDFPTRVPFSSSTALSFGI